MALLLTLLMLIPAPPDPALRPCELRKIHRHKPRVCSKGGCVKCTNKECARVHCGRPKKNL